MIDWKKKSINKTRKGSTTPGISKGDNCKATPLDKWMAKAGRSYKHPEYSNWCKSHRG